MISVILGLQFGDEGKGKITDFLSRSSSDTSSSGSITIPFPSMTLLLCIAPAGTINEYKSVAIGAVIKSSLRDGCTNLGVRNSTRATR